MVNQIVSGRKNIKDLAYESIKESIISGDLNPGEVLTEEFLAKSLGISRTPLREAVNILIRENWIVKEKSRIKVAPLTKAELTNLFLLRQYLEVLAAIQAVENVTPEFLNDLKEIMNKMERAEKLENTEEVVKLGSDFHARIIEQADNPHLKEMVETILEKIKRYRHIGVNTVSTRSKSAVEEHFTILRAIETQNSDLAEEAMKDHIKLSQESIKLSEKIEGNEDNEKI
ncbi:GntR family transcriptional regulator [Alteribacillus sp. YIM 98480]|uniref:GntR family transcriptional regulator n=1 Tax=Alteribacillus sp. YIM 98480 TaxID=2606599 RepID=UPI00131ADD6B|nr:GntR family transcriptional regulator [Alteribacillus sp. YIM 98480]